MVGMSDMEQCLPSVHELKTWTDPFEAIWLAKKGFEFRRNDRNFHLGDYLLLKEWYPPSDTVDIMADPPVGYSGRVILARVHYILFGGQFGLPEGYCIMQLKVLQKFENRGVAKDVMQP